MTFYLDCKRELDVDENDYTLALYHFPSGVVSSSSPVTHDYSSFSRDLILQNYSSTYGGQPSGFVNYGLDFNGTSQYATIGGTNFNTKNFQSGAVQVEVWIPPQWPKPSGTIFDISGNLRLAYNFASGAFEGLISDGSHSQYLYSVSSGIRGDWNYIALTWSSGGATSYGSGYASLYFNGDIEAQASGLVPQPSTLSSGSVGARYDGTDLLSNGVVIDELRLSSTNYTNDTIRNHYYREKELYKLNVQRGTTHISDSFSATIWNPNARKTDKYFPFDNVKISSNGKVIFIGRIENVTPDKNLGDVLDLDGRDFRAELQERYAIETYASGTQSSDIVSDIIHKYSQNILIHNIQATSRYLQGSRTFAGTSAYEVIYTLAKEDNYDAHLHIHQQGSIGFHYEPKGFQDSGYSLIEGQDYILYVKSPQFGYDLANKATIVGASPTGSSTPYISTADNFDTQTQLGVVKEYFQVDTSLATQGDVDAAATSVISQQSQIVQIIELQILLTTPNTVSEWLNPGDLITLNIPTHQIINQQYAVIDMTFDFPAGTLYMKLAGYRKEIEDYLFRYFASLQEQEAKSLQKTTLPKIMRFAEDIKIKEFATTISTRDLGTSFVVGDKTLGKVGRRL